MAMFLMWSHKLYKISESIPEVKAPRILVLLDPGVLLDYVRWYEFFLSSPRFSKKSSCISPLPRP